MPDDSTPPPYAREEAAARAAVDLVARLEDDLAAARAAQPDALRAYFLAAIDHITAKEQAARLGLGESTYRLHTRDAAQQRRAAVRAERAAGRPI